MTACKHEKEANECDIKEALSRIMPKMFKAIHDELRASELSGKRMNDEMFSNFIISLSVSFLINLTISTFDNDINYEQAVLASSKMIEKVKDNFLQNITLCLQRELNTPVNLH